MIRDDSLHARCRFTVLLMTEPNRQGKARVVGQRSGWPGLIPAALNAKPRLYPSSCAGPAYAVAGFQCHYLP